MEEGPIDVETKGGGDDGLTLFDVSTPDNVLVYPAPDSGFLHEKLKIPTAGESSILPSMSTESDISLRNDKYNMRKSLAWDSAFFTCEGVLEPEELSSIIEGADNNGCKPRQMLSEIQEDLSASESISAFASDSLLLETLEADLFRDIRASIQKSSRASNLRTSVRSKEAEGVEPTSTPRAKNIHPRHGNNAKTPLKKPTGSLQGLAKPVKVGFTGGQPFGENHKSSSSVPLRPQRATGKVSSAANAASMRQPKRMLVDAGRVKSESNKLGSTRAGQVGNPGRSRNVVPKSTSSSKSSVRSSTVTISVSSSCDSTTSSSGGSHQVSSRSSLQRKGNGTGKLSSANSIQRTPLKVGMEGKVQPAASASRLSTSVKSKSNQHSTLSPVCSVSVRSSVSSTSSLTGNRKFSGSKKSLGLNDGDSVEKNEPQGLKALPLEQTLNGPQKKVEKVQKRYVPKSLAGNGSSSRPLSGKPSGLRMPSPKIGFFDGAKPSGRTPVGGTQLRSGLSTNRTTKSGVGNVSPTGVTNKCRPANSTVKSASKATVSPSRNSITGVLESASVHTSSPKVKGEKSTSKLSRLSSSGAGKSNLNGSKSSPRVDSNSKSTEETNLIQEMSYTSEKTKRPEVGKNLKDLAGLRTPFTVKNSLIDLV